MPCNLPLSNSSFIGYVQQIQKYINIKTSHVLLLDHEVLPSQVEEEACATQHTAGMRIGIGTIVKYMILDMGYTSYSTTNINLINQVIPYSNSIEIVD